MFAGLAVWHWLIIGVALVILEMLTPGVVFLWLGIAAFVTAAAVFGAGLVAGADAEALLTGANMAWEVQLLLFALFSVASIVVGRRWFRRHLTPSDRPDLNRRGEQYVGRRFTLETPIINGFGRLKVGDTVWRIAGDDLPPGSAVVVVGVDGTTLLVSDRDQAATAAAARPARGGR
jgi:membrane protein implicated in regulation of membrane protease activity